MNTMNLLAFLQNMNGPEILMIFLVVLLFFGADRLPGIFRSLGNSVREFKKATQGIEEDIRSAMNAESEPEPPAVSKQSKHIVDALDGECEVKVDSGKNS